MGFVGNYAPRGLSPQTDGMPVIHKKRPILCMVLLSAMDQAGVEPASKPALGILLRAYSVFILTGRPD